MKLVDKMIWCQRGHFPTHYGFCPSPAAWEREMRRLGLDKPYPPYPSSAGNCTHFEAQHGPDGHKECVIVTCSSEPDASGGDYVSVLAHEAMHVFQTICESVGEKQPSPEFSAYTLQAILTELMRAFEATRGQLFVRRGPHARYKELTETKTTTRRNVARPRRKS